MAQNNDIFKLVEEVENQRKKQLDDILQILDEDQKEDKPVVDVKQKVNQVTPSLSSLNVKTSYTPSNRINLPTFPSQVTFDTRFDCFKALIEGVNYGRENSPEYVEAHKQALQDVYQDASNNKNDLYLIEARVNDEINRTISKTTIREKGYYDGLMYALKAIRKSKQLMIDKITNILNNTLN